MCVRFSVGRAAAQDLLACARSYIDPLDDVMQGSKGRKTVRVRNQGKSFTSMCTISFVWQTLIYHHPDFFEISLLESQILRWFVTVSWGGVYFVTWYRLQDAACPMKVYDHQATPGRMKLTNFDRWPTPCHLRQSTGQKKQVDESKTKVYWACIY